jgi:hypothetical protein
MTLLDIVQSLELGRKSAHVVLQYDDGRNGEVAVKDGDLRGCQSGELTGDNAFFVLSKPGPGLFRIEYRPSTVGQNITRPNTFLILEAMRRLDEEGRPPDQSEVEIVLEEPRPSSPGISFLDEDETSEVPPTQPQAPAAPTPAFRPTIPGLMPLDFARDAEPSYESTEIALEPPSDPITEVRARPRPAPSRLGRQGSSNPPPPRLNAPPAPRFSPPSPSQAVPPPALSKTWSDRPAPAREAAPPAAADSFAWPGE